MLRRQGSHLVVTPGGKETPELRPLTLLPSNVTVIKRHPLLKTIL